MCWMFFSYIQNKMKNVRNKVGPLLDNDNDKQIRNDKDMDSILNLMFNNVTLRRIMQLFLTAKGISWYFMSLI